MSDISGITSDDRAQNNRISSISARHQVELTHKQAEAYQFLQHKLVSSLIIQTINPNQG